MRIAAGVDRRRLASPRRRFSVINHTLRVKAIQARPRAGEALPQARAFRTLVDETRESSYEGRALVAAGDRTRCSTLGALTLKHIPDGEFPLRVVLALEALRLGLSVGPILGLRFRVVARL